MTEFWADRMTTEAQRKTRRPRHGSYWYQPHHRRRRKIATFHREIDDLIARRIRTERVFAGLRQIDLAGAIGMTQSTLSRIEAGKRPASFAEIARIAIQLRVPPAAFIEPPSQGTTTGWQRRQPVPLIPIDLETKALDGELPEDHEIYD
jgi:transcriptional regulator with XRE-family HTH domain